MLYAPDAIGDGVRSGPGRELFANGADIGPLAVAGEICGGFGGGAQSGELGWGEDGLDDDEAVALEAGEVLGWVRGGHGG